MDRMYFKLVYVIGNSLQTNTNVVKKVKKSCFIIKDNSNKQAQESLGI